MRITSVGLRNFKAFGPSEQTAPLGKRLTLIFGPNSAGKSSILQSLLLLRQSWASEPSIVSLNPQGTFVDLGRAGNLVHGHTGEAFSIGVGGFWLSSQSSAGREFGLTSFTFGSNSVGSQNDVALQWSSTLEQIHVKAEAREWVWNVLDADVDTDSAGPDASLNLETSPPFWARKAEDANPVASEAHDLQALLGGAAPPARGILRVRDRQTRASLEGTAIPNGQEIDALTRRLLALRGPAEASLNRYLESEFQQHVLGVRDAVGVVKHIGQARAPGKRIYELDTTAGRNHVGRQGEHVAEMLFNDGELLVTTNELLALIEAGVQLRFNPSLRTASTAVELLAEPDGANVLVTLCDVGSGIAQVLPVLVQYAHEAKAALRGESGILWVEQPELHLHPRMQALLLRLLLQPADAAIRPQIVFETHSEIIVTALRQIVSDGNLNASDVRILWVERAEDGQSFITDLQLNEDGGFGRPWPRGYFSERLDIGTGRISWSGS